MRRFDLDSLHTLVTVADLGSLSAAAAHLCRSQSAVSEQVRKLEELCASTLFQRGKKGVSLTPAGDRLLNHARSLLRLNDVAWMDMQGVVLSGDLRLAITDYFRPTDLAGILKGLSDQYPRLRLHVLVRKSALIEQDVDSSDFDLGLSMTIVDGTHAAEDDGAHRRVTLRREPLVWVAGASYKLDPTAPLPLITLPGKCAMQRLAIARLGEERIRYFVAHTASGVSGLQSALSAGLGIACLNASAVPGGVRALEREAGLPGLPMVEFALLIPRSGESDLVREAAEVLINRFR
jgi:DNA-binding transcriptional LysR family regulator